MLLRRLCDWLHKKSARRPFFFVCSRFLIGVTNRICWGEAFLPNSPENNLRLVTVGKAMSQRAESQKRYDYAVGYFDKAKKFGRW